MTLSLLFCRRQARHIAAAGYLSSCAQQKQASIRDYALLYIHLQSFCSASTVPRAPTPLISSAQVLNATRAPRQDLSDDLLLGHHTPCPFPSDLVSLRICISPLLRAPYTCRHPLAAPPDVVSIHRSHSFISGRRRPRTRDLLPRRARSRSSSTPSRRVLAGLAPPA